MSGSLPLVLGPQGAIAATPSALNQTLIQNAEALSPGLTTNLPASLVEDLASTGTGALLVIDQARVDAVDNVSPYAANAFVLAQLGAQFGIPQGQPSNTNVYVVIAGPAGYVVPAGFVVGDGTYQYVIQDGGTIATNGSTSALYAVATQSGSWAVPAATVTQIITSIPSAYTLTVTNPSEGTPGASAEDVSSYRSRVLLAGQVAATGTPAYLKTLLYALPAVQKRLVRVLSVSGGWEIIVGGGDAYQIAGAIYIAVPDLSRIVGSSTTARNVSATITDAPDTYSITYVNPPQQTVTISATWNTTDTNFTASAQVNQLALPALQSYVNSIAVGNPMNELEMTAAFQEAVASVLPSPKLTTLTFSVTINGTSVSPTAGTSVIPGDPESYFYAAATGITVAQG